MPSKARKPQDFYKSFVKNIDGVKCFILPESKADEFFDKFLAEAGVCDEGSEHKDDLLQKLFGLQKFSVQATAFAEAKVTVEVRAKSKTEAINIAKTRFEGKPVRIADSDNISFKTKDDENYVLKDVRPSEASL